MSVPRGSCFLIITDIDVIAVPFYNIIKVMINGQNKLSNTKKKKLKLKSSLLFMIECLFGKGQAGMCLCTLCIQFQGNVSYGSTNKD